MTGCARMMALVSKGLFIHGVVEREYKKDDKLEGLTQLERLFLYLPLGTSLNMAIPGSSFGIYSFTTSSVGNVCFMNPSCNEPDSPYECERGDFYKCWIYKGSFVLIEC